MYDILATSAHSRHEHDPPQISPGQVRCGFDRVAVDFHGPHVTSRPAGQPEGATRRCNGGYRIGPGADLIGVPSQSLEMTLDDLLEGFRSSYLASTVQHCVAVGTNRTQVPDRINLAAPTSLCQWLEVVDMNEAMADLAVLLREVKTTHLTGTAVVFNTG